MPWSPFILIFIFLIPARCSMVLAAAVLFLCPAPHNQPAAASAPNIYIYISLEICRGNMHVYLGLAGEVTKGSDERLL